MKKLSICLFLSLFFLPACGQKKDSTIISENEDFTSKSVVIDPEGKSIESRFNLPEGFVRIQSIEQSFGLYLRNLPLKDIGSSVLYFDGNSKRKENVYEAVVDLPIGTKDLHQCADAVMRLRAEYLWSQKRFNEIHFNLTNGFRVDYAEWMKGKRVIVEGNKTYWKSTTTASNTYKDFWKYLEFIFTYAGTLSLSKELKSVKLDELKIGDVFIRGGSPGHAVIVVDIAEHSETKKKIFLLAQSYMPAQEIQILKNPNDETMSPWYSEDFTTSLETPEWTFKETELMRFEE